MNHDFSVYFLQIFLGMLQLICIFEWPWRRMCSSEGQKCRINLAAALEVLWILQTFLLLFFLQIVLAQL